MLFLENMWTAFTQVSILVILALLGFITHRTGLFTEKASRACTGLLFYIVTPCMIANSFLQLSRSAETLKLLGWTLVAAVLFHLLGALITRFCFNRSAEDGVYKFASMYGNVGFMGIPLFQAVLGDKGVFICSVIIFVFNFFCFTHGATLMRRTGNGGTKWIKILLNPGTIGLAMGLPLFLLDVDLPILLSDPLRYLSSLNTPLAMLMLGTYLGATELGKILKIKENYGVLLLKLILLPAITLGVSYLVGVRGLLLIGFTIMACVPTATNTVLFAAQFERDTGRASMAIAFCSIASVLTMPIWIALAQLLA